MNFSSWKRGTKDSWLESRRVKKHERGFARFLQSRLLSETWQHQNYRRWTLTCDTLYSIAVWNEIRREVLEKLTFKLKVYEEASNSGRKIFASTHEHKLSPSLFVLCTRLFAALTLTRWMRSKEGNKARESQFHRAFRFSTPARHSSNLFLMLFMVRSRWVRFNKKEFKWNDIITETKKSNQGHNSVFPGKPWRIGTAEGKKTFQRKNSMNKLA